MTYAAVVRGLHKSYGSSAVLRGVNLEIPSAGVMALLGPSGCGKTTLLRTLGGFDRVDAGTVEISGHIVDGPGAYVPPRRRRIGYVPQEGALFAHLTVAGNVGFGVPRRTRSRRTGEMLALIGMADMADRRTDELSGGQQQRVALARALAVEPCLVLLDEPFSALDASLRAQVRTDILNLLRRTGTATLLVTHDQDEALSVADEIAVLDRGRIVQIGPPQQLYRAPVEAAVARFLGSGTLLPATLRNGTVTCALGRLDTADAGPEQRGNVLVRSDQVVLGAGGVLGRVVSRAYHGHATMITIELNSGELITARCDGTGPPEVDSTASVSVRGAVVFLSQ